MQFGRSFRDCLARDAQGIIDVMRVSVRLARGAVEPAKLAVNVADVRRIEMPVDVEISRAAMLLPADGVGEFAQGVEIVRREKRYAVFKRQARAAFYFGADFVQFLVV